MLVEKEGLWESSCLFYCDKCSREDYLIFLRFIHLHNSKISELLGGIAETYPNRNTFMN